MSTVRIQIRRGESTDWENIDPVLADGELGIEIDTNKMKVGNNGATWTSLPYLNTVPSDLQNTLGDYVELATVGNPDGPAKLDIDGNLLIPASSIILEGSSADAYETILTVTNPTADRTITFPNASGTVVLSDGSGNVTVSGNLTVEGTTTTVNSTQVNIQNSFVFEGATANDYETTLTTIEPTADRTISLPDASGTIALTSDIAELSQDAINDAITVTNGLTKNYGDPANTLELSVDYNVIATTEYLDQEVGTLSGRIDDAVFDISELQTEVGTKAPSDSPTFTGTVGGITKSMVGLGDVDNTSDLDKPISNATQLELDLKATLLDPTFDGTVVLPINTSIGNVTSTEISQLAGIATNIQDQLDLLQPKVENITNTEIGYLNNLTGEIQTQLDGKVDDFAELTYLTGISSNVQDQLDAKQPIITGVSNVEIGYLDGVTSKIQDQLDDKFNVADASTTNIAEGTNLYYTNERAQDAIGNSVGDGLKYNDATGEIDVDLETVAGGLFINQSGKLAVDGYYVTYNGSEQTLTNKTLTAPKINENVELTANSTELNILDGATLSTTELNYLDGVTSAIQTQIDSKSPINNPTFTGTVAGITKSMVGLGNVDNTTDANKPVSTATQTALDLKANLSGPTFTDTVTLPSTTSIGDVSATEIGYVNGVTSSIQTQLDSKLPLAGGTMTGLLTLSGAPTADLHAATKLYVDNVTAGINFHPAVHTATTENLSGTYYNGTNGVGATLTANGGQQNTVLVIDGQTMNVGERVLVKDQTTQTQNGIYVVTNAGKANPGGNNWILTRATDADNNPVGEMKNGDFCLVLTGTSNASYGYINNSTSNPIVIGTNNITYSAFNAAKTISAGTGLSEPTPGTLSIATGGVTSAMIENETIVNEDISASAAIAQSKISGLTTDLAAKAPIADPTFTGTVTVAASGIAFTDGTQTKEGVASRTPISQKTTSYTLSSLTERDTLIEIGSSSATTVTIPADSTVNYPVGTSLDILQTSTGQVTIAGAVGVTVNSTPGLKLRTQWSSATLFKRAANTWVVYGDLSA